MSCIGDRKVGQPLPLPPENYDTQHQNRLRRTVELNVQEIYADLVCVRDELQAQINVLTLLVGDPDDGAELPGLGGLTLEDSLKYLLSAATGGTGPIKTLAPYVRIGMNCAFK
jgi:hypothetical protein